ncbi:MAG: metal ABC transporter permease, partial [Planctomycetaceae bacterium]|nr:metal ABC transporter permease [Planctomycetaceae bacterium]
MRSRIAHRRSGVIIGLGLLIVLVTPHLIYAQEGTSQSLRIKNPIYDTLSHYNTQIVLLGTTILGVCGGVVGVFMLLRKRSLVGDVVGHASLPGIAIAFLVMEASQPGTGRTLSGLLIGATISAIVGVLCTLLIVNQTRVKEDAALAIVLSIFYGLGIALFTVIQSIPSGSSAGLRDFIFGKAALLVLADVKLIAQASVVVLVLCCFLFKEFSLLCFDEQFAAALGWPSTLLDLLLMGIVVSVTV